MARAGRSADDVGWMVKILRDLEMGDWVEVTGKQHGTMKLGVSYVRKRTFDGYKFVIVEAHTETRGHYLVGGYGGDSALDIQIPPKFVILQQPAAEEVTRIRSIRVLPQDEIPDP